MTSRSLRFLLTLGVGLLLVACASTKTQSSGSRSDLLTRDDIMNSGAMNLYDVINRLRPRWLTVRSTRSFNMETEIVVFQDQMLLGGPDELRDLSLDMAFEIQYMDGARAVAALPGLMSGRHIEAAIIVKTRGSGGG